MNDIERRIKKCMVIEKIHRVLQQEEIVKMDCSTFDGNSIYSIKKHKGGIQK